MFSLQESINHAEKQLKEIRSYMDSTGSYHPDAASLYTGLKQAEAYELHETLKAVTYPQLREYLGKGQTLGDYLIAAKVHDDLVTYSIEKDIVPLISKQVIYGWQGGDLSVDIPSRTGYLAEETASGAIGGTSTVETMQATLSPVSFTVNPRIANDLVQDTNLELLPWHLSNAATAAAEKASDLAMRVLGAAADGWGTLNSGNASADETTWAQIQTGIAANTDDHWKTNTIVINPEAWEHSVKDAFGTETAGGAAGDYWQPQHPYATPTTHPVPAGFDFTILNLDFLLYVCDYNHLAGETAAMTNCITVIFDRNNALLTGRKRWMQLNNYADPVKDLSCMTVSCRQDSVSLYDDCVYTLSET